MQSAFFLISMVFAMKNRKILFSLTCNPEFCAFSAGAGRLEPAFLTVGHLNERGA